MARSFPPDVIVLDSDALIHARLGRGRVNPQIVQALVHPAVSEREADRLARVAKALADPIRIQLVDVLRRHAGKVCVCELTPLFDVSQPTVSHHLKVLREAGVIASERRGTWIYYWLEPKAAHRIAALGRMLTRGATAEPKRVTKPALVTA